MLFLMQDFQTLQVVRLWTQINMFCFHLLRLGDIQKMYLNVAFIKGNPKSIHYVGFCD